VDVLINHHESVWVVRLWDVDNVIYFQSALSHSPDRVSDKP